MQGFRNYPMENHQRDQQIVVDLMPQQYTKPTTPPPSPPMQGTTDSLNLCNISQQKNTLFFFFNCYPLDND